VSSIEIACHPTAQEESLPNRSLASTAADRRPWRSYTAKSYRNLALAPGILRYPYSERRARGRTKAKERRGGGGGDEGAHSVWSGASVLARTSRSARSRASGVTEILASVRSGPPVPVRISLSDGSDAAILPTISRSARPSAPVLARIPRSARSDHEILAATFLVGACRSEISHPWRAHISSPRPGRLVCVKKFFPHERLILWSPLPSCPAPTWPRPVGRS